MPSPPEPVPDRPLTPGEALAELFLDNADRGANAANDDLVHELTERNPVDDDQASDLARAEVAGIAEPKIMKVLGLKFYLR